MEKAEAMEAGAEVVEAVQWMKNCHFASARRSCSESSSSAPWTVSAMSISTYSSSGTHTSPCTFYRPLRAASALTHSMDGPDHGYTSD